MSMRYLFWSGILYTAILGVYFPGMYPLNKIKGGGAGDFITKERIKYEYMRLRDPNTGLIPANIKHYETEYVRTLAPAEGKTAYSKIQSARWDRRGPFEVGGRTRALAIDVSNENTMLAGGVSGGMWRSDDAGLSWRKATLPGQLHSVSAIAQDTREGKQNTWYYCTGELWGNSASINGDGIFKSTDGGNSWKQLASTATLAPQSWDNKFDYCWNITANPAAPADRDEVLVATALGGLYRTTDGGESWTAVMGGSGNGYSLFSDIAVTSKGIFYATMSQRSGVTNANSAAMGIYRSVDGVKWVNITPPDMPEKYNRIVIGIAPSDESQVYFVAETPNSGKMTFNTLGDTLWHSLWKYTYISGTGEGEGGKWENRSYQLPAPALIRGQMNSQGSYDLVLKVKPDNPDVVFIGATALYSTKDGFKTDNYSWIGGTCPFDNCSYEWRYPNHHADLHAITFLPSNPNVMFTGSDGGVHKTMTCMADTMNWISLNNGYFTTQFYSCAIDHSPKGDERIIGGLQDNGTLLSHDPDINKPWTVPGNGDGFHCLVPDGADFYYTSNNSSYQPKIKIFRVKHGTDGVNTISTRIDPIGGRDFIWNTPFVLDPGNNNIMYLAGGKMVWRNNDLSTIPFVNSKDSTSINWDSLPGTRTQGNITAINISKNPAGVLYYGTANGKVYRVDNAGTGLPEARDIGMKSWSGYVGCIAIDPDNADNAFVSFTNYGIISIYMTTDGGANWTPVAGNLEEEPDGTGAGPAVNWVQIVKTGAGKLYFAGTSAGLYSTAYLNGRNTAWEPEGSDAIGNIVIDMLDSRDTDGFVVAASHGSGMFAAKINSMPQAPGTTVLTAPADLAKAIRDTVTVRWQPLPGAVMYRLQLAEDAGFTKIVKDEEGIRKAAFTLSGLEQGCKTYYWRVAALNSAGYGGFTAAWSFRTAVRAPQLIYPENSKENVTIETPLKWSKVDEAVNYHVQMSKSFSFTKFVLDTIVPAEGAGMKVSGLEISSRYFWRVSAIDADGEGVNSDRFYFKTKSETSVIDLEGGIRIANFPNPVAGKSRVEFSIESADNVVLTITDTRGALVARIFEGFLAPGGHSYPFDGSAFEPGAYFINLKIGDKHVTKSMLIVR